MNILNYIDSVLDSEINFEDEELNYLNPIVMIKYIYNKPLEFFLFGLTIFIIFLVDFIAQKNALIYGVTQIPRIRPQNNLISNKIPKISKKNKIKQ
jgi:hypothetical protein